ncbi:MAG: redoxin domain-containing protein, partial [Chloroflexota bacterium]|nr:redoxin domain-containing protein [Chloroflexota bacterium]
AYADRYGLGYTIGFDGSGHVFRAYKIYALPTQFFVDVNGVIAQVVNGPVDERGAEALIEALLPDPAAESSAP